jgi:hypothetical protein
MLIYNLKVQMYPPLHMGVKLGFLSQGKNIEGVSEQSAVP